MISSRDHHIAEVMEAMPYGLYIVGSTGEDGPNGMMADWLGQVSFKPRLVCVAIENDAHTLANVRAGGVFTVNFLREDPAGMNLARRFASPYFGSKIGGPTAKGVHPKLVTEAHWLTASGCPVLEAAMAWLDCRVEEFIPAGDHTLVLGHVRDGHMQAEATPLTSTYTGWTYSG